MGRGRVRAHLQLQHDVDAVLLQLHVDDVHDVHHREGQRRRRLGALLIRVRLGLGLVLGVVLEG